MEIKGAQNKQNNFQKKKKKQTWRCNISHFKPYYKTRVIVDSTGIQIYYINIRNRIQSPEISIPLQSTDFFKGIFKEQF